MSQRVLRILIVLVLVLPFSSSFAEDHSCRVTIVAYDGRGQEIEARIVGVYPESYEDLNLLKSNDPSVRVFANRGLLEFPAAALGRRFVLDLDVERATPFRTQLTLAYCNQRSSIVVNALDSGYDTSGTELIAKLSGCKFNNRWWARAMPMFGSQVVAGSYEGTIDQSTSELRFVATFTGERYILIIGRDRTPIKAIGVDVVAGRKNDIGTVELNGICSTPFEGKPKERNSEIRR